ncbi:beta subunit of N-acylethanolamine-hydrolyzing acid amidase-domain-containing protein [Colletotrichum phormii]|uniref:ceramidase n=1 Tax=Colletotrichum phormii TaxID=359342 RepID=A0AAI9ZD20_9PEZI|nr:beta subunit of N-acylethanolamine-hydrolyzing acid amidase-domain-containing protein [Colletotrichum phormii]KAK1622253.1 beta subunit of N-acylethanolamine-hydrolyzing acid amidase-domain-containing protein [Colletotrichum phormii]
MLTPEPDNIPIYKIDMAKPAGERYIELAKDLAPQIRRVSPLLDEVIEAIFAPGALSSFAKFTSRATLRKVFDPEQTKEIKSIAKVAGIPTHRLMALNTFLDLMLGCTSGAALVRGDSKNHAGDRGPDRLLHFRTLEWGMDVLRDILVIIEYVNTSNGSNEVIARSVTYAGFVGMLTGVRKGLSVSLNFRPGHECGYGCLIKHQLAVLFGLRESVPSMLRRIILNENISTKNANAYDTKVPNPLENSEKPTFITSIAKKIASFNASPCYLTLCDGKQVVNILKDLHDGKIKTSNLFQIQCNHDPDHRRCCGRLAVRHGADPVQAKPMESEAWIEESGERQNAFHEKWIEHIRAITNGIDITWAKQNSCCTDLELDAEASKSGEIPGIDEAKLREWVATYPTTNEATHFMCIMDPLTGGIHWISRGPRYSGSF